MLAGCSHMSLTKDLLTPDFLLSKGSKQITFQGDNDRPRFSPDNQRLIYSSHHRGNQKNAQIFEMDLARNKERRVTYSDGDAFDPFYLSTTELMYASTTDEIKESPFLNRNPDKDFPPSDLYMSDRFGSEILRITQQPGFDAEALYVNHPVKPFIIFTSRRGDVTGVYRMDLKNWLVSLIAAEKDKDRRSPTISPNRKDAAFIETDLKTNTQSLQLIDLKTKKMQTLKENEGTYRDLFFAPRSPDRLFYSILRKGEKKFQLEVYNVDSKCTQVVFKGSDSLMTPTVSDEPNERLAFTRLFQDKKQIYIVNLPQDLGPCLEAQNAVEKPKESVKTAPTPVPTTSPTPQVPAK
ncbi:MAG: PD40 domain-containing protein [Bdellovibrio sp.]|nr:PD40 domain-containing protein [Bdellovibrio sp.]